MTDNCSKLDFKLDSVWESLRKLGKTLSPRNENKCIRTLVSSLPVGFFCLHVSSLPLKQHKE